MIIESPTRAARPRHLRHAAFALLAMASAAGAQTPPSADATRAEEDRLQLSLLAGASASDNLARVSEGEEDGTIGRVGVIFGYTEQSRRLEADVDVNAAYETYSDNTFDDGIVGGGDAKLIVGIAPERFQWFFQENFGQINLDPFAATTPDNRENINYFTTGPDFIAHLPGDNSLHLSGRYSDTQYEVRDFDGTELGGSVSFAHQLSSAGTLSLNIEASRFEFDDETANPNYDRSRVYASYEIQGKRTLLNVDAGYSALDLDGDTSDGLLARLSLTRRMSSASTLTFSGGTQFADSGELFRWGQDVGGVDLQTSEMLASSDPFKGTFASLGYDYNRGRSSFGLNFQYDKEEYETDSTLDRKDLTWSAYVSRQLSAVLMARVFAHLSQQKFDALDFDDDELRAGFSVDWALGRVVSLRMTYEHFDRDSSEDDGQFSENVASLFVIWSPVRK